MKGKFDSYRDSALHFLARVGWCNASFGDVSTYGVFIDRISNSLEEVHTLNTEINSVLEEWEQANPELLGVLECSLEDFRKTLVGHFLISESETGAVRVREFPTEERLIQQFEAMRDDFDRFMKDEELEEDEDEDEEPGGMTRIQEEWEYKFGDDRL